jgi:ATP phosphoribosyltransferase
VLLESEAVLVARDEDVAAPFTAMLRAVVEARRHRYVMLNAPESSLKAICELVAPRTPSVLPLAEAGMVAVHALVPSAEIWHLLPQLEAAGGTSILVVPVERMSA